ncbi:hypothetical protein SAMN05192533_11035 [Mesobacillus persicus]|uniref:Uncharacterized protein n=1 Tax=Mesobacillus persicus TaxID=930146 RepID=A0A1H8EMS9_9BACI|nr:hypothetical protein SAMN05192533_11035 [Mesobacillus persicus]
MIHKLVLQGLFHLKRHSPIYDGLCLFKPPVSDIPSQIVPAFAQ